jgi:hypothetical protein
MAMAGGEIAVQVLKEIRDEIRGLRADNNDRLDEVRDEIHALRAETAERFGQVETALLDLVEHNRSVLRALQRRGDGSRPK